MPYGILNIRPEMFVFEVSFDMFHIAFLEDSDTVIASHLYILKAVTSLCFFNSDLILGPSVLSVIISY
jgi:hypothetical protein